MVTNDVLLQVVNRLENAINELKSGKSAPAGEVNINKALLTTEKIAASTDYWNKTLKLLLEMRAAATETGVKEIELLTDIVTEAICAHQDVLVATESFKKPVGNDLQTLAKKIGSITGRVQDMLKNNINFALHSEAVKNGLEVLYWLYAESSCDTIAQTYFESIDFPGNKIFMKKIPAETKWVKAFKAVIKEIVDYVTKNHKAGLVWSLKGDDSVSNLILTLGITYRKNFKKQTDKEEEQKNDKEDGRQKIQDMITSGQIRSSLKPIGKIEPPKEEPKVEATNTTKVTQHAATITSTSNSTSTTKSSSKAGETKRGRRETLFKKGKQEVFDEGKRSFTYENLEGETRELDPERLKIGTVINISNCINCTFKISKKVNRIKLTNCEEVNIICDSLISMFEIINSLKLRIQVEGTVNSFSVDGSTDVIITLSLASAGAQLYAAKSSEVKLKLAKEEDPLDFTELLIPEQFVFSINANRKLDSRVSELYNY